MTDNTAAFDLRGLIENSLLEWENNVSAVAIAGGCNLRCPYCHSWRYVTGLGDLDRLDPEALFTLLERQAGWIDGVVFTGGEPTLQPGLAGMIGRTKELGVKTKLHTNGARPEVVAGLLEDKLLDCLSLDYKAPLDGRFFAASGAEADDGLLDKVRETFRLTADAGALVDKEYHTTLAPGFIDAPTLAEMAKNLEPGGTWFLQQFENKDCLDRAVVGGRQYAGRELDDLFEAAKVWHGRVILKKGSSA